MLTIFLEKRVHGLPIQIRNFKWLIGFNSIYDDKGRLNCHNILIYSEFKILLHFFICNACRELVFKWFIKNCFFRKFNIPLNLSAIYTHIFSYRLAAVWCLSQLLNFLIAVRTQNYLFIWQDTHIEEWRSKKVCEVS